jgi:hypothetical protein
MYVRSPQIFQKPRSHLKILGDRRGKINQVATVRPTNIKHQPTKFSHLGDLVSRICALLTYATKITKKTSLHTIRYTYL